MSIQKITLEGMARFPAFCHAVIAGDFIHVSGTLGSRHGTMELVEGGIHAETVQTLRNMEAILEACGASLVDLVKVNVFLANMDDYHPMNEAYVEVIGADPPARITVAKAGLALGAAVEMDGVAYKPR